MKRRDFVASTASAVALAGAPGRAAAQIHVPPRRLLLHTRLEVTEFSATPALVQALRNGVAAMMAVTDPTDNRSWQYWHNSHYMSSGSPPPPMAKVWNQCTHGVPYFYAWHRGFVYYFESMLRRMAATAGPVPASFALPYWNYYKNPNIPAIYASPTYDGGKANPLYNSTRTGTTMSGLSFLPYANTVVNFPQGWSNNYEDLVEDNPHGTVHGEIGGDMGIVPTAGADPIFWAHHCNIDRLWSAWLKAGGSRAMPPASNSWWNKDWAYDVAGTWKVGVRGMNDTLDLGYTFRDLTLPSMFIILPHLPLVVSELQAVAPVRPNALATAHGLALGLKSASVALPVPAERRQKLHALAAQGGANAVNLVLEGVELTDAGRKGGYSYQVFINLPAQGGTGTSADPSRYYVGSVNSFNISVQETMHPGSGVTLILPLSTALQAQARAGTLKTDNVTVSFVRAGEPKGATADTQFVKIAGISILAGSPK